MPKGICLECGKEYFGWPLIQKTGEDKVKCGAKLKIYVTDRNNSEQLVDKDEKACPDSEVSLMEKERDLGR